MTLQNKHVKAKPFQGRLYVCLYDEDGDETFPHGVLVAPPSVRTTKRAVTEINQALAKVKKTNPHEWNYDDLIAAMVVLGWHHFSPIQWVEGDQVT